MLTFDKVFDLFTMLGLFPAKCEKSLIRFYYEYSIPDEMGLDFNDFSLFLPILGMDIVERHVKANKPKKKKADWKIGLTNVTTTETSDPDANIGPFEYVKEIIA